MILKYLIVFLYLIYLINNVNGQNCTCYADVNSKSAVGQCGSTSETACPTIPQALSTCRDNETVTYSSVTLLIQPGNYIINKGDITFGTITNKTIQISSFNNVTNKVNIDLTNSIEPFINFQSAPWDNNQVNLQYIQFVIGNTTGSVILNNGTNYIDVDVNHCSVYQYKGMVSRGVFLFLGTPSLSGSGKFTLTNTQFYYIIVGSSGGIIMNNGSNIGFKIDSCTFTGISSTSIGGIGYSTFTEFGYFSISSTEFQSCQSISHFYLESNVQSNINLPVFEFTNVLVDYFQDGVVFEITGTANSIFIGCTFSNSISSSAPLIIASSAGEVSFDSCKFWFNNNTDPSTFGNGAIMALSTSLFINNCQFVSNFAINGGAVYMKSSIENVTATISNSLFDLNTAEVNGSSIYNENLKVVTIINVTFKENQYGNGIFCLNSEMGFSNSTFVLNGKNVTCPIYNAIDCKVINLDTNENLDCKGIGLTKGEKIGISIGAVGGFVLILICSFFIYKKYIKKNDYSSIN